MESLGPTFHLERSFMACCVSLRFRWPNFLRFFRFMKFVELFENKKKFNQTNTKTRKCPSLVTITTTYNNRNNL